VERIYLVDISYHNYRLFYLLLDMDKKGRMAMKIYKKIYIVLWKDRHTDTTAHPFFDLDEAKGWAKEQAESFCRFPEDLKEKPTAGWLYHIVYSCEGDCLWITEHELGINARGKGLLSTFIGNL